MKTVQISLNSIDKVKSFVNEITKYDNDFDLVSGRYVIDAKSIMGIFSLDLSKPIDLNIHADSNLDDILAALDSYIIWESFFVSVEVPSGSYGNYSLPRKAIAYFAENIVYLIRLARHDESVAARCGVFYSPALIYPQSGAVSGQLLLVRRISVYIATFDFT